MRFALIFAAMLIGMSIESLSPKEVKYDNKVEGTIFFALGVAFAMDIIELNKNNSKKG